MSPIDDELRAALRGRADVLTPAPDPLAGIERRARGIRRQRIAASLTGSALAVAAIALAVPALMPSALPDQLPPPIATVEPSPSPTSSVATMDLDAPWPYRGAVDVTGNGQLEKFTRAWAAIEGVPENQVDFVPLYGEFLAGNGRLVYAARVRDTAVMEYGLAVSPDGEAQFLSRTPLAPQTAALVVPAPGDGEFLSLLVVAAPDSRSVNYAPDGATFGPMEVPEPGVGFTLLKGDTSRDAVTVIAADGSVAFRGQAPSFSDSSELPVEGVPDNLLGWGSRGETDDVLVGRAVAGFARQKDADPADVQYQVLFTGSNDPGQEYTVVEAYLPGQKAQVFGWVESPGRETMADIRPATEPGTVAVAILLTEIPGRTTDELVVVSKPGTEVRYRSSTGAPDRPVGVEGLDGVALVDRAVEGPDNPTVNDSIVVLDGEGKAIFDGPVDSLLCGEKSCG